MRYLVNVFTKSEGRESASSFAKAKRHMLQILTYLLCDVCGSALLKVKMRRAVSWGVNCTLYGCVNWKIVNKVSDKFTASVFGVEYTGCHRRNGPNFGRVFLMLNYTDITQNTYVQS